jgi:hypothetical protein
VVRKLPRLLLVLALLASSGAHWAVLQSVAWTAMLAENLRTVSLAEAVHKTFDGQHPCSLCKQISAGKKSQKKAELSLSLKKLDFDSRRTTFVFSAPQNFTLLPEQSCSARQLAHKPPAPPPRSPVA